MKIKMQLISDVVFGNGMSIPGGEDISVLCDEYGFPYYKGSTIKGIFREELERYLSWTLADRAERNETLNVLLGQSGDDNILNQRKLVFSDFQLSDYVKKQVLQEIGADAEAVKNACSHIRTFTSMEESGTVKDGSLRNARCVNKGLYFYSEVSCQPRDEEMVKEVLALIKWLGSMRNRGFGKVKIWAEE